MEWRELMVDGYDRLPDLMKEILAGLRTAELDWQPHRDCNSLGWTAWHLTRVQDSQVADLMGEEQLWIKDGWHKKFKRAGDPTPSDLDHELNEPWQKPLPTAGVRVVSVLADCHQHAGEASYIRGLVKAKGKRSK